MAVISLGSVGVDINGTDLGSVSSVSLDLQMDTLPVHDAKVGTAYIVGNKFAVRGFSGSLNVSTEEPSLVSSIIASMQAALNGAAVAKVDFTCTFPLTGSTITGKVALVPQLSATVSPEGWSNITIQPMICGALSGSGGNATINNVANVPFLSTTTQGALTNNRGNLCAAVTCGGKGVGSLNVSVASQVVPIYRSGNPWPTNYVIEAARVTADIGFYDMASLTAAFETETPISVVFKSISGTSDLTLDFGSKCLKVLGGLRSAGNGLNTWHIKVEGNAI